MIGRNNIILSSEADGESMTRRNNILTREQSSSTSSTMTGAERKILTREQSSSTSSIMTGAERKILTKRSTSPRNADSGMTGVASSQERRKDQSPPLFDRPLFRRTEGQNVELIPTSSPSLVHPRFFRGTALVHHHPSSIITPRSSS